MKNNFDLIAGMAHDSRVFGFLFDSNYQTLKLNFILYIQLFGDFDSGKFSLEKAFLVFENTKISKLNITDDIYAGQFYITDIQTKQLENGEFIFEFNFNDSSIELTLIAENLKLVQSGNVQKEDIQFLNTNWMNLLH
ncbi:hypothetical protein [Acinetobacter sp. ANC 3791]|uniref:hypothetical protein n=1 Tax=Acinetobacter sp. ANC 3791 TaxID=2529836 RepID=UPI00103DE8DD|nr:hypothetical protein [Acinetobacter sp. ANC 3791]TCB86288.1 hypothetical protein E0H90_00220 [Acinetobacter sp. ANC 3791]